MLNKKTLIILSILLFTGCSSVKEIRCLKENEDKTKIEVITTIERNNINNITMNGITEYDDLNVFNYKCDELIGNDILCENGNIIQKNIQSEYLSKKDIETIKKMSLEKYIKQMEENGYKCEKK